MSGQHHDVRLQEAFLREQRETLYARVRKVWADNIDDPDFTMEMLALRFSMNVGTASAIIGKDVVRAKKRDVSSVGAVRQRKRRGAA